MSSASIVLAGVAKHFEGRAILDGFTVELAAGDGVALLGPSGSGKSTLLNCISGLDDVDAGSIRCGEQILTDLDERARTRFRRERCGIVFQSRGLVPTLTLRENVLLRPSLLGERLGEWQDRAEELLRAVGVEHRADAFPDQCSGGEQQRAAIAAAMIHDPDILLADEPTGSLDVATAGQVLDVLDQLRRRSGTTVLMATHDAKAAARMDHVWRIVAGACRVEESGEGAPS